MSTSARLARRFALPAGCILLVAAAIAVPVAPLGQNLGFEDFNAGAGRLVPTIWYAGGEGYDVVIDTAVRLEGRASLRSRRVDGAWGQGSSFGVATQSVVPGEARGRAVRLTGWVRTEAVDQGSGALWMRVDGPERRTLAFRNTAATGTTGTTGWTRHEITLPVDSAALAIYFGAIHPGNGTAWFDSLHIEIVGPARPRQPLPPPPPSTPSYAAPERPAEEMTRLLTDPELAPDSASAPESPEVAAWIRANAKPIRSLGADDFSDLRFLAPILRDKRIVQLGESGHGVKEFNLAKVRLIRYLHEELGYDVIAFESSLFECDRAGRAADSLDAATLMRSCIFGVWHAEEVLPLFEYVKRTRATSRPLVLTGIDVQTSTSTATRRPAFFRRVAGVVDSAYATRVHKVDSVFLATAPMAVSRWPAAMRDSLVPFYDSLVPFYDSLAAWFAQHERALAARLPDDPSAPRLARQTARSIARYVQHRTAGSLAAGSSLRDLGMADNIDFVLDELYAGKKVMVWAHNSHIRHQGFGGAAVDTARMMRMMGSWVAERRRPELYTIGLYMYRGSAANNARTPYVIRPAASGSLESILRQAPWRYHFVDLSRAARVPGSEWIFTPTAAREWGTQPGRFIPRDEYDGILFVDRTWPPNYLPYRAVR